MEIKLANRVQKIKPSPTLALGAKAAELKAEGKDIINLTVGEPDFDTPDYIKEAAIKAIESGQTKYTAVDGIKPLKDAIIQKFKSENQLEYANDQVLVSNGVKQGLYNLCQAILSEGDDALIPTPYWVSYPAMVLLAGANHVSVPTSFDNDFKLTPDMLANAITPKSKLIFLNSPSNPSGVAYTKDELSGLAEVLKQHPNLLIASLKSGKI